MFDAVIAQAVPRRLIVDGTRTIAGLERGGIGERRIGARSNGTTWSSSAAASPGCPRRGDCATGTSLLLEASDRLGGRVRSEPYGDYWMNYGAHLFPAPGSLVDTMAREVDLEMVPVWGGMMGLAVGDKRLTSGRIESYPFRLPLSVGDRVAFAMKGLQIQRAVAAYQRKPSPAGRHAGRRPDRVLGYLDDRTFADFLGGCRTPSNGIFATASHRATAELDELSAGCGIGLFALVWGGKKSLIARNLLGGTGRLPAALGRASSGTRHGLRRGPGDPSRRGRARRRVPRPRCGMRRPRPPS